jgi:hypothetical protein
MADGNGLLVVSWSASAPWRFRSFVSVDRRTDSAWLLDRSHSVVIYLPTGQYEVGLASKDPRDQSLRCLVEPKLIVPVQAGYETLVEYNKRDSTEYFTCWPHRKSRGNLPPLPRDVADVWRFDLRSPLNPPFEASYRVQEIGRYERILGTPEVRIIDNAKSASPVTRTFRVSREWTRTLSVDTESVRRLTTGTELPLLKLKAEVEQAIRNHFASTFQETRTFEDTVVITAAPYTRTEVTFTWKEVRQKGAVTALRGSVAEAELHFESIIGLAFDQKQSDHPQG